MIWQNDIPPSMSMRIYICVLKYFIMARPQPKSPALGSSAVSYFQMLSLPCKLEKKKHKEFFS